MFEFIEKDISNPKLTVNPNDGRITLKYPIGYNKMNLARLVTFTKRIVNHILVEAKITKTHRGRFDLLNNEYIIKMYSESGRSSRKSGKRKEYIPEMKEHESWL